MAVIYLRLREHSEGFVQTNLLTASSLSEKIDSELQNISDKSAKILLILDGFDEYNDKTLRIFPDTIPH